jgi:transcriptional regulator with XRE-family HTH domain
MKDLAKRIRSLREERKWTQTELAQKLEIHQKQISAYERGANKPPADILFRIAEVFDVTLDYLAYEKTNSNTKVNIKDRELLRLFETIDTYSEEEISLTKNILTMVEKQHKFKELIGA